MGVQDATLETEDEGVDPEDVTQAVWFLLVYELLFRW